MQETLTIGIAGGTGSGKSTITGQLKERFGDQVSVLYHDSYYKAHHDLSYEERTHLNYDHPDSLDTDLLIAALRELKAGRAVNCPVYDFTIHDRTDEVVTVLPAPVIVVEGILILQNEELSKELDIKLFVDADADVRILRRVLRDVKERGRSLDSIVTQYLTTVKPMHERFVEPSKKNADVIIPEGGFNKVALRIIEERVRAHLSEGEEE